MNEKKSDMAFGEIAIEKGYITREELEASLKIQAEDDVLKTGHRPIGRIMLNEGFITLQQVGNVLKSMDRFHEKETDKGFGEIAIEMGFTTRDQLDDALRTQTNEYGSTGKRKSIGRILLNKGLITLKQIGEVLKQKKEQRD